MNKKVKTILLTVGIVLLGFLREYLFVNINWVYLTLVNGRRNGARPEFNFFLEWSPSEIITLKWILTIVFAGLFFGLTRFIIHTYYKNKTYNKLTALVFIGLIFLSTLLFCIGKIFGVYEILYGGIRTLMGFVQSFMPLMILVVLFNFLPDRKGN